VRQWVVVGGCKRQVELAAQVAPFGFHAIHCTEPRDKDLATLADRELPLLPFQPYDRPGRQGLAVCEHDRQEPTFRVAHRKVDREPASVCPYQTLLAYLLRSYGGDWARKRLSGNSLGAYVDLIVVLPYQP
jgi:hypothetical protein